jgi:hypothetical protein
MEIFCARFREAYNDLEEYGEPTAPYTATSQFLSVIQDDSLAAAKALLRSTHPKTINSAIQ